MFLSLFTDELAMDFYEALPILKEWGMKYVDFRGRVNGKPIERQTDEELRELKRVLDENGMKVGALQSSLCKVHLPDAARRAEEMEKLEGLIRAANILDCRLVRAFGSQRVLFATDSPWACQKTSVQALDALPLSDAEKADIFSGNACRLLGLPQA